MAQNNLLGKIIEGSTEVFVYKNKEKQKGPGVKQGFPFYNSAMELNRDLSVLVCQWLVDNCDKKLFLLDGLSASGIRGVRIANEVDGEFDVVVNDWSEQSYDLINKNVKYGGFSNVVAENKNLNVLLSERFFDYIDVDPFGSPVYFVDSAIRSIRNNGVISCTATDTAALCGVYPRVCLRRYGARPFHGVVMKEIGLRILLGFICKIAARYDKGFEPLVCYVTDHYFRVYVRIKKGVNRANDSLKNVSSFSSNELFYKKDKVVDVGPLWMGRLGETKVIQSLRTLVFEKKLGSKNSLWRLLDLLEGESQGSCFFYTTDSVASKLKCSPPRMDSVFEKIRNKGFSVYHTHFCPTGFKTDMPEELLISIFE